MNNELEISRVRTLVSNIRDAHIIKVHNNDDEFEIYSPDNYKLSFILTGKYDEAEYIINIHNLSTAKIVNNDLIVDAYDNQCGENVKLRISLFSKIPVKINHLAK